jgi:hypothetical protein
MSGLARKVFPVSYRTDLPYRSVPFSGIEYEQDRRYGGGHHHESEKTHH